MPVVGPEEAKELLAYFNHPEPPLASEGWIEAQIGALSIKPQKNRNTVEANLLLESYIPLMMEHTQVDLGYAVGRLMRESKWFPDISEILALANYRKSERSFRRTQAWKLVHKHRTQWVADIPEDELCTAEDIERIKAEVEAEFSARSNRSGAE